MSRSINISVPSEHTQRLLDALQAVDGVTGVSLHRGASLRPAGDLVTVQSSNDASQAVRALAEAQGVGREFGGIVTSEPRSILTAGGQDAIDGETNEMSWREMSSQMRQESNLSSNYVLTMLFSGSVAAAGLWTDTVHLVIGAMVIAPGFEPVIRIPFGAMDRTEHSAARGIRALLVGYLFLAGGAALTAAILGATDPSAGELRDLRWVRYWSTVQSSSLLVALVGGAAGAVIIAAGRSVLTAGVMIALALIPSMTIVGMALAVGDLSLAGEGLFRWAVETVCVAGAGGAVFLAKRTTRHAGS